MPRRPKRRAASCSKRSSASRRRADEMHEHAHDSLTRVAVLATLHCLTGCAIGEVLGMVIATAVGLGDLASIALAVVLAFAFGFGLTVLSVRRAGVPLRRALSLAVASDTVSIAVMEVVDNA